MSDKPYELAGDRISLTHSDNGTMTVKFDDVGTGRVCGSCQLCCRLLPIPGPPLHKPAGIRCRHQRHSKGCTIYKTRPMACRVFACRWLADRAECGDMPRPDRVHYVIDLQDDYVEMVVEEDGTRRKVGVIQVWVDPAHRDAHREPHLRAYMLRQAEKYGAATIIRYGSREGFVVFPPPLASDGQWHEQTGDIVTRNATDATVMADLERYQETTNER